MPTNHEAVAALPAGLVNAVKQLIRDMNVRRMAYVVSTAAEVTDLVAVDPVSGAAILVITCLGREYLYDPTDTTSAHDGVSVLVSFEGRRYKLAAGTDVVVYSVINNTTSTPPGSPVIGDAYLIAAGATGAWSGHSNQIGVFTSRGWEFINPAIGRLIYVKAIDTYYHKNAGGTLVTGIGSQVAASNTIPISAMINRPVRHFIENQTTNAPPGSAAVGVAYVIGPSPTGSWSGNAGKLAICEVVNTFTIYTPQIGELAYDKALAKDIKWSGTAWTPGSDGLVLIASYTLSGASFNIGEGFMNDTYDSYLLKIASLKVSSDGSALSLQIGTGGPPPTYQTSANSYRFSQVGVADDGVGYNGGNQGTADSILLTQSGQGIGSAGGENYNGVFEFNNPEASDFMIIKFTSTYYRADNRVNYVSGAGRYVSAVAITGLHFFVSAGSVASGRAYFFGYRKA